MMRLLYVTDLLAIHGGLERVLVDKMNWLSMRSQYEVFLLTANQGSHPVVFPLSPNVTHYNLEVPFQQQYRYHCLIRWLVKLKLHHLFRRKLRFVIKEIVPDVVICPRRDLVADVERVRGNIPMVYESHSSRLAGKFENWGIWQRLLTKYYECHIRKVQMLVSLTEGDASEWRKLMPFVKVIPNVVHLNETGHLSDCQSKSVIFVGRYSMQKDIGTLLHIWSLVHKKHPDWQLHVYGGYGEQSDSIHTMISQMNANIVEHKPTSQIFDAYLNSSLLLLTSLYEPFGLVLPEAMSCGLPVIAFNCPYGPIDILSDAKDGYLIEKGDIEGFVDKVCLLLENSELRCQMGKAASVSSQKYKAECIMPEWEVLFKDMIN